MLENRKILPAEKFGKILPFDKTTITYKANSFIKNNVYMTLG